MARNRARNSPSMARCKVMITVWNQYKQLLVLVTLVDCVSCHYALPAVLWPLTRLLSAATPACRRDLYYAKNVINLLEVVLNINQLASCNCRCKMWFTCYLISQIVDASKSTFISVLSIHTDPPPPPPLSNFTVQQVFSLYCAKHITPFVLLTFALAQILC